MIFDPGSGWYFSEFLLFLAVFFFLLGFLVKAYSAKQYRAWPFSPYLWWNQHVTNWSCQTIKITHLIFSLIYLRHRLDSSLNWHNRLKIFSRQHFKKKVIHVHWICVVCSLVNKMTTYYITTNHTFKLCKVDGCHGFYKFCVTGCRRSWGHVVFFTHMICKTSSWQW